MGPCRDKRDGTEVGMHRGVGGAVSGDDDGIGKSDGESGGDDGVGWMGQVICIYPYLKLLILIFESAGETLFKKMTFSTGSLDH